MAAQLIVDGQTPLLAWRQVVETVCRNGESRGGLKELIHLTVVARNARPLSPSEIHEYRRLAGDEPWERVKHIYTRGLKVGWKPSYIGRLTEWREGQHVVDQLAQIVNKAIKTPGSKTLCACVFHPRDLKRFIVASVPCLLSLDFKVRNGAVHVGAFFRSQDVYRLFLGDYHYVSAIREELTQSLNASRRARKSGFRSGDLIFYLCSAHLRSSVSKMFLHSQLGAGG